MRVSGRGWKAHAPAGQRPITGAAAVPPGNSVRRNRARKPCQLGATFCALAGGGQSQGLWRLQRPRRGCGRSRRPAHEMSGHFSHEQWCNGACQLDASGPQRKPASRGTGGLSGGGSARGAVRGCGCTERAPARDPCRVRRGAVCAEAEAHCPRTSPERLKMAKYNCLSGFVRLGGILSGDKMKRNSRCWLETSVTPESHKSSTYSSQYSALLLVLHVQCLWGAVHVDELPPAATTLLGSSSTCTPAVCS